MLFLPAYRSENFLDTRDSVEAENDPASNRINYIRNIVLQTKGVVGDG
jgi:hypothetical protein